MPKDRIDINLGCGHMILSLFLGIATLIAVTGAIILLFIGLLLS